VPVALLDAITVLRAGYFKKGQSGKNGSFQHSFSYEGKGHFIHSFIKEHAFFCEKLP